MALSFQGRLPTRSGVPTPRAYSFPGRRVAPSLALLVAAMLGGAPALAEPPAESAPPPAPAATFAPATAPTTSDVLTPPQPRRSPEGIAGGITVTVLGAGGVLTGIMLLFSAIASGAMGGNNWQGLVAGGTTSLALGGVGLGVGIPLLRSGARKIVRDPPSAQLWIAPSTLTVSF